MEVPGHLSYGTLLCVGAVYTLYYEVITFYLLLHFVLFLVLLFGNVAGGCLAPADIEA